QYHRYTIDIYVHYALLAKAVRRDTAHAVLPALSRMFDVLLHLTRGDGTIPLVGDDDGGRLVQLDGRPPHDVRALLATGAVMLEREDLAWVGRGDDAAHCWLLGSRAVELRDALVSKAPPACARAFRDGGIYTMRDGWGNSSSVAVIDAGPHGALSYGHSHADALSIDLSIAGRPLFVDAGTYTYVGDERNAFRATSAHNTVEIDGVGTSIPDTAFRWRKVSHATATAWEAAPEYSYFSGTHDGYRDLPDPVQHERAVLHNHEGLWVVRDAISSAGRHSAVLRWHCAPGLNPLEVREASGQSQLAIDELSSPRALLVMCGSAAGGMSLDAGWVSGQFGHKAAATVCTWRQPVNGNAVLASIVIDSARYGIAPSGGNDHAARVHGAAAVLALDIVASANTEQMLIMVGNGGTLTFNRRQFDADIVLLRIDTLTGQQLGQIAVPLLSPA
ncbi:MAG: heparinase II/III-family protein, partial [Phycisphaerae bacterium]|nr:heparinase II/III-family protein [Gemmatimonadaceae bacterium]